MGISIKIPAVGESVTSGILSAWLKKEGESVKDGEPIFALETDKISTEVPAPSSGRLSISVQAGEEVKIGQVVGSIEEAGQGAPESKTKTLAPAESAPKAEQDSESKPVPADQLRESPAVEKSEEKFRLEDVPPSVRRMVAEENIPLEQVPGSGRHGQVTKEDLVNFQEKRKASGPEPSESVSADRATDEPSLPDADGTGQSPDPRTTRRRMTPLRRKIAAQLVMAQQTAAMLTTFNEVDMTGILALRSRHQENFQKRHGIKVGFMSFFIKAVVEALHAVPAVNARLDGEDLVQNHFYDIGVAVSTEKGLVVPVVRDADHKSFAQLEKDVAGFAAKARDGKLQLDDLTGGVFTITNGGIFGSLLSTPILNPPQSGILGMHTIQKRPCAVNDQIEIRPMMYLALSYDHRVVDGKEAVTFLVRVKECVEDPARILLQG